MAFPLEIDDLARAERHRAVRSWYNGGSSGSGSAVPGGSAQDKRDDVSEFHIQRYLRGGGDIDALVTLYGITAKRHPEFPSLVLFKYNQISSPMHEPIVQDCRGIILDEAAGWAVAAMAFRKFMNAGDPLAAPIDWPTARVQEKVDGSMFLLAHYGGRWRVSTTGSPDAGGDVNGLRADGTWEPASDMCPGVCMLLPSTFAHYFWQVVDVRGYGLTPYDASLPTNVCFYFELTGPLNRIVVPHTSARLTLLGARDRVTHQEMTVTEAHALLGGRVPAVREFSLGSIDGILATFSEMSPLAQEGYVVVDGAFNRIKVKHPGYVALHHAKDGLSRRAFVEIARSGEIPEVIAAFPELKPQLDEARVRLDALVGEVEADYAGFRDIGSQKDFAIAIRGCRNTAAMFSLRAGKTQSIRAWFAVQPIDGLMKALGYRADAGPVKDQE